MEKMIKQGNFQNIVVKPRAQKGSLVKNKIICFFLIVTAHLKISSYQMLLMNLLLFSFLGAAFSEGKDSIVSNPAKVVDLRDEDRSVGVGTINEIENPDSWVRIEDPVINIVTYNESVSKNRLNDGLMYPTPIRVVRNEGQKFAKHLKHKLKTNSATTKDTVYRSPITNNNSSLTDNSHHFGPSDTSTRPNNVTEGAHVETSSGNHQPPSAPVAPIEETKDQHTHEVHPTGSSNHEVPVSSTDTDNSNNQLLNQQHTGQTSIQHPQPSGLSAFPHSQEPTPGSSNSIPDEQHSSGPLIAESAFPSSSLVE